MCTSTILAILFGSPALLCGCQERTSSAPVPISEKHSSSSNPQGKSADDEPKRSGKTLSAWIRQLGSESEFEREQAASEIGDFLLKAKPAVPALIEVIKNDRSDRVRARAVRAIERIGPEAKAAVPALVKVLNDPQYQKQDGMRVAVMTALAWIGPAAKEALPALIKALDDHDLISHRAAMTLGALRAEAKAAVPDLIKLAKRGGRSFHAAAMALGSIGPGAKEAVPLLEDGLGDGNTTWSRIAAAEALWRIQKDSRAIPLLERIAASNEPLVRQMAKDALEDIRKMIKAGEAK